MRVLVALLFALVLPTACAAAPVLDVDVSGTYPAHCVARGKLPDRSCTPGATNPHVTQHNVQDTICQPGWARMQRPPEAETQRLKTAAMAAYGIPASQRWAVELDHLIPDELGGSSEVANLWPEVSDLPHARPRWRNSKDDVEGRLHEAVCSGRMTLAEAQWRIATDWTVAAGP